MIKKFNMKNLDCANCAAKMESAIRRIRGVNDASISFMSQRLTIDANDENFTVIMAEVERACKKIEPDCAIVM